MIHQDILAWSKEYSGEKFHAVLCDPPYELGFMGKSWDSTGIAFNPDTWRGIAQHLYPGAYLLAFGGTRTFHRIAVAIEDAGFEIRDTVMWVYGSGFPKSHNVGKAVDKVEGNEREVVGTQSSDDIRGGNLKNDENKRIITEITKGNSPWEGYGTALKPAWEPIIIARLPIEGTVAHNAQKYGTGALNIDGSRVETKEETGRDNTGIKGKMLDPAKGWNANSMVGLDTRGHGLGRWPANLIHDGSDEVVGLFPNSNGQGKHKKAHYNPKQLVNLGGGQVNTSYTDIGSAARFFYSAKVSKLERDAGLEGFEEKEGIRINAPRENEEVKTKLRTNNHPTLKPIALTSYLAKLILPPKLDKPRRLLVPFAGAGSEMIGALQAGWDEVVGVEQSQEYCDIAEARIKHWIAQKVQESLDI